MRLRYHLYIFLFIFSIDYLVEGLFNRNGAVVKNLSFTIFQWPFFLYLFSFAITFLLVYFINVLFVCPNFINKKKYFIFILLQVFLLMLFSIVRFVLDEVVIYKLIGMHNYTTECREFKIYFFDNSAYAIKVLGYSLFAYLIVEYDVSRNLIHKLELDQKKSELDFLRSQIEPHFLFNTLNSFYSDLIDENPKIAKDILRLSNLLRYVVNHSTNEFVPLEKELNFLENYVHLYRRRFESNLYFSYEVKGQLGFQKVPTLVLINFLENIFKHGVVNERSFPARMRIFISENSIYLITVNKILASYSNVTKGIGYANVEKRLYATFKDDYSLVCKKTKNVFIARLIMPLQIN
jgi:two-component system LytT family sensor kinase